MTALQRFRLRRFAKSLAVAFLIPMGIWLATYQRWSWAAVGAAAVSGLPMALGMSWLELSLIPAFRERPLIWTLGARATGYAISMATCMALSIWLFQAVGNGVSPWDPALVRAMAGLLSSPAFFLALAVGVAGCFGITFWINLNKKLGRGIMRDWLLGRYHQPKEEDRIFMFLDMKDSTTLAEQLGNLKFSGLIRDCFTDIAEALLSTEAQASYFVGDEAVITWRMEAGLRNANCLRCFDLVKWEIERKADRYRGRYGVVPQFKAGVHGGRVVVTEVGLISSQLVYHGDVLNTAARIQAMCGQLGRDLLVSAEIAAHLSPLRPMASLGRHELKGKEHPVEIYAAEPQIASVRRSG